MDDKHELHAYSGIALIDTGQALYWAASLSLHVSSFIVSAYN